MGESSSIPLIDLEPVLAGAERDPVVAAIGRACRDHGFFYVVGHGVDPDLITRLEQLNRLFFAQHEKTKLALPMEKGGRAWRGYFSVGDELTQGTPDQKEGLYFGAELPADHPKVLADVPLHGPNLVPAMDGYRDALLEYLDALTQLGHLLTELLALSLGLESRYFYDRYTRDPLILFRVFHYPPLSAPERWSVGEHTDYGFLTILWQDESGGLQVRSKDQWIDAPPIRGSFVCNIGDMLDRMTAGRFKSTPHRVRNLSATGRLSMPFFFDPNFDAEVQPVVSGAQIEDDKATRWDGESVHEFRGTYGEYLVRKVSKVFPALGDEYLA